MLLPATNKNPDSRWQTIRKMYCLCNRKSWFIMGVWLGWSIGTAIWSAISIVFISGLCHHKHLLLSGWIQNFQPSNPERITQGNRSFIPLSSPKKQENSQNSLTKISFLPCPIGEIFYFITISGPIRFTPWAATGQVSKANHIVMQSTQEHKNLGLEEFHS